MLRQSLQGVRLTSKISRQKELVPELQERVGRYRLMSLMLAAPPDSAILEDAAAAGFIDEDWRKIHSVDDIQMEYTRLFSAPGADAIASHQSVYTDTLEIESTPPDPTGCGMSFPGGQFSGYLGGKSCAEATRWYQEAGFQPSTDFNHMADHISVELDFMAYLFLAQARALEAGLEEDAQSYRELRDEFYGCFLGKWLKIFLQKVAANKVSAFYRSLASNFLTILSAIPDRRST